MSVERTLHAIVVMVDMFVCSPWPWVILGAIIAVQILIRIVGGNWHE